MKKRILQGVLAIAVLLPSVARAQQRPVWGFSFGKKGVPVTIDHPSTLPLSLKGKTVVVMAQGDNPCTQPFADQLEQLFQANGVNLVDRANLATVLKEQHIEVSEGVDPSTAVQLGKVAGLTAMIFVRVSRCTARQDEPLQERQLIGKPVLISRTEAHFQGSIKTVELATGRVLGTNPVQTDEKAENRAYDVRPEYPVPEEVQDRAVQKAVQQANQLYFPWVEHRMVPFRDSKTCDLKQEYDLLRTGDLNGVLRMALDNAEACKSDPKPQHEADALYNLGITYMLMRKYPESLAALTQSQQLHSDNTVIEAITECKREQVLEALPKLPADPPPAPKQPVAQSSGQGLNNDSVVEMVKGGLPENMIIKEIGRKACTFSLNPSDLIALKKAGVPDAVVEAMLDKK